MKFGTIIQIGDVLVSEDVIKEWFCCDYEVCRGQCCISGDSGAPLEEWEPGNLERQYPSFKDAMLPAGRDAIDANGFFELDRDGELVTTLVPGSGVCAYAHFDGDGNCLCAIEKCGGHKPVSCSIYPIRVTRFNGGGCAFNLHHWDICDCAREKGRRDGVRAYQFLKRPITDVYGVDFYDALCAAAEHLLESDV